MSAKTVSMELVALRLMIQLLRLHVLLASIEQMMDRYLYAETALQAITALRHLRGLSLAQAVLTP